MLEPVTVIEDAHKARAMLPVLRQQILAAALAPISATGIAAQLGLPRQRVNYHVRALATAGLLRRAGRRQRRGLVEQRWVAAAQSVIVAPRLAEGIAVDHRAIAPDVGAMYLIALATTVQREVATGARVANRAGRALPSLAFDSELHFESAGQRARFAAAIQTAIESAIANHTTASAGGPTYRLALGVYPITENTDDTQTSRPLRQRQRHRRRPRTRAVARVG
jgi:DNA-binding transcriptional ArsR family regulator